jgi:hypothetical protein
MQDTTQIIMQTVKTENEIFLTKRGLMKPRFCFFNGGSCGGLSIILNLANILITNGRFWSVQAFGESHASTLFFAIASLLTMKFLIKIDAENPDGPSRNPSRSPGGKSTI